MTQKNKQDHLGYAVRPKHRLRNTDHKGNVIFKIRNILNIIFIVTAIVGACLYTMSSYQSIGSFVLIFAVTVKITEVSLRIFHK
ncbi:mechanosensitive ion channel protein MscS [Prevotella sp. oral taxon 820]|nr:mechanosensitive ion channel protein MscS [Prevotella sp. oral taxon 820]